MSEPRLVGVLDGPDARFVDSTGADYRLWDAAHNATAICRHEFAAWARANIHADGVTWCEALFGPDQHAGPFDHERTDDWVRKA